MTTEGFQNQSTSTVYRWLTQDENLRNQLRVLAVDAGNQSPALAQEIEAMVTDFHNPLAGHNSLYAELIQAVFKEVSWQDIAETFLDEN